MQIDLFCTPSSNGHCSCQLQIHQGPLTSWFQIIAFTREYGVVGRGDMSYIWSCRSVYRRQDVCVAKVILWILSSCTYWWENRYPYPPLLHDGTTPHSWLMTPLPILGWWPPHPYLADDLPTHTWLMTPRHSWLMTPLPILGWRPPYPYLPDDPPPPWLDEVLIQVSFSSVCLKAGPHETCAAGTSCHFMLCSCRLNKCSISYWQSIMNFNTIKQQIEIIIMKNRWLYSLLLVSIIYLVLFYFNFTAYIGDYFEEEKYGFCIHCNGSVMCGTCKCARTLLHWIVKWWRFSPYSILSAFTFDNRSRPILSVLTQAGNVYQTKNINSFWEFPVWYKAICIP